jgi:FKBP-type peptidyl-prolyl cis-trans isomerase SlyD
MVIENKKVVSLIYELRANEANGEIIEALSEDKPLTFIYGTGSLLPKFEANISGLKVGDSFNFKLDCIDAYGIAVDEAVVDIPKSVFEIDGEFDDQMVQEGAAIPMMDGQGNRLNGIVVSVSESTVKMDFNHPLAGDDLFFSGKVVEIREATEEELAKGHIGGGCSCGGDCSDGCESDCDSESGCGSGGCGCH